jgi:hypothetical protein
VEPDTVARDGRSGPDSRAWTKEVDEEGIEQYVGRDNKALLAEQGPEATDLRPPEVVEEQEGWMAEVDQAAAENTVEPTDPEQEVEASE